MSNQEVVDFVQVRIAEEKELSVICEELMSNCLAPEATLGSQGFIFSNTANII
jgi:protein phosphatase 2C family protein 2/3